ncbi:MAG: 3-hydroxyacyl-CoA dehydrogenase family protein [Thermoleophilaceae bacterium]
MELKRVGVLGCDFVGLHTLRAICDVLFGAICDVLFDEFRERRFARPPTLRNLLSAGWYGRKSGRGFHDYSGEAPGGGRAALSRPSVEQRAQVIHAGTGSLTGVPRPAVGLHGEPAVEPAVA